ncbi:PIG-L deacetylase family protein [Massilia glaciei]|uniref:PIG-L deacetylase family protein n=1 Tax=Massilia glaciei TaxID=1524097 RepID=UPI001C6290A4|nr:PIG-L deacetylase family protein [Massilia glaciei]
MVAPHPDDEVLGVGGTLLRRKAEGAKLAWLIMTSISVKTGWPEETVRRRADEIARVTELFGFDEVFMLDFPTTALDQQSVSDLVGGVSAAFKAFAPEEVFLPHPSDIHTDHRLSFDAAAGCTKWFRYPSVRRVLAYETLSETDFSMGVTPAFAPNVYVDIAPYLEGKLRAMSFYASEVGEFPFPRSYEALRALATLRGAASGFHAAEAFQLLRERS